MVLNALINSFFFCQGMLYNVKKSDTKWKNKTWQKTKITQRKFCKHCVLVLNSFCWFLHCAAHRLLVIQIVWVMMYWSIWQFLLHLCKIISFSTVNFSFITCLWCHNNQWCPLLILGQYKGGRMISLSFMPLGKIMWYLFSYELQPNVYLIISDIFLCTWWHQFLLHSHILFGTAGHKHTNVHNTHLWLTMMSAILDRCECGKNKSFYKFLQMCL